MILMKNFVVTNNWKNINYEKLKKLFIYNNIMSIFFYDGGYSHPSKFNHYKDFASVYEEIKN